MARIKFNKAIDVEGLPGNALGDMALEDAEEILEGMGFWDYIRSQPVVLDSVVMHVPHSSDVIHEANGRKELGKALANAILAAAKSQISGFSLGSMGAEEQVRSGSGGGTGGGNVPSHVREIPWSDISSVRKSAAGAVSGVYFLETPEGTVVVKPSEDVGNEAFSLLLAQELGLGTPSISVIEIDPGQLGTLQGLSQHASEMLYGNLVSKDHALAMSCVKGMNLDEMDAATAERILGGELGKTQLHDMGKLAALDLWTGNDDRFPLHGTGGNPGNVMFDAETGQLMVIDQMVGTLSASSGGDQFTRLFSFAGEIQGDPSHPSSLAKNIAGMVANTTTFNPGDHAAATIQAGIVDGLKRIMALDKARLEELKAQVGSSVRGSDDINAEWLMELSQDALASSLKDYL